MSIEAEYEILSRIELFQSLDSIPLKRLIFVSQRYQLQAGEYLFRQNDTSDTVFAIIQGECSVLADSQHGEIVIAVQGVGSWWVKWLPFRVSHAMHPFEQTAPAKS